MFSLTKSLYPVRGCFYRSKLTVNLVFRPDYSENFKNKAIAFSTSLTVNQDVATGSKAHLDKVPLAEKVREMRRKAQPFALPNLICASRLALAPVTGYFIMNNMHSYALACIAAAAMTDVADKVAAKMLNYRSDIHVKLDYIADKTLLVTAMINLCQMDIMPVWMFRGLFIRELLVASFSLIIRYASLGENPTIRKYFDLHNHPMLGMEPNHSGQILTGTQYTLCAYYLYLASQGASLSGWTLFNLELFTALMSSITLAVRFQSLTKYAFLIRPVNL